MLHNSGVRRLIFLPPPPNFFIQIFSAGIFLFLFQYLFEKFVNIPCAGKYRENAYKRRSAIVAANTNTSCWFWYWNSLTYLSKRLRPSKLTSSHVWGIKRYERSPERHIMEKNVSNKIIVNEDLKIIMQWRQYKITEGLLGANASVFQYSHKV